MTATVLWKADENGGKAKGSWMEQNALQVVGLSRKQLLGLWLGAMFLGAGLFGIGCWIGALIKPAGYKKQTTNGYAMQHVQKVVQIKAAQSVAQPTEKQEVTTDEICYIVLGIYRHKDNAKDLEARIKAYGKIPNIKEQSNQTIVVYLGPYSSKIAAQSDLDSLSQGTYINGSILKTLPGDEK